MVLEYVRAIPDLIVELFTPVAKHPAQGLWSRPPLVIGHRGSPCAEVENTIPSYARALERDGANGIELDLCLTEDGEVVVWHDWDPANIQTVARAQCLEPDVQCCPRFPDEDRWRRRVSQLRLVEFFQHFGYARKSEPNTRIDACIPTFAAFVEWASRRRGLEVVFLDIKIPSDELDAVPKLMSRVLEVLARQPIRFTPIFETAEPKVLEAMKRYSPTNCFTLDVQPPNGIVLRPEHHSAVQAAIEHGNTYATVMYPRITLAPWTTYKRIIKHDVALLQCAAENNRPRQVDRLVGFTINDEEEMRALLALGLEGIQTDRPDRLSAVVRRMQEEAAELRNGRSARRAKRLSPT